MRNKIIILRIFIVLFYTSILLISTSELDAAPKKIQKGCAWVTAYYPPEPSAYRDAMGKKCTMRTAASNKLPLYSIIEIHGIGRRIIIDRGSKRNDIIANHKGAEIWIDLWYPNKSMSQKALKKTMYKYKIIRLGKGRNSIKKH